MPMTFRPRPAFDQDPCETRSILSRVGGIAALIHAAVWLCFIVLLAVVLPRLGLPSPRALEDPKVLLPALHRSRAVLLVPGLDLLAGLSLAAVALALEGAAPGSHPRIRLAAPLGLAAGVLFVVLGTVRIHVLPKLADLYATAPMLASRQYAFAEQLFTGAGNGLRILLGAWLLLVNAGSSPGHVRWHASLGALLGVLNLCTFLFLPLGAPNLVLLPIWFFTTGRALLQRGSAPASGSLP